MSTGGCGDGSVVNGMAEELFQLASLLVGTGGRALPLIEQALATLEIDPCIEPQAARQQARQAVVRTALAQLTVEQPSAFAGQSDEAGEPTPCVNDDDLLAAGVTPEQLRAWLDMQGQDEFHSPARTWLEGLPVAQRAVFVQRAVLGQGNEAAASLLREAGGAQTSSWTPEKVGSQFRRALCSLADSLAHAPGIAPVPA